MKSEKRNDSPKPELLFCADICTSYVRGIWREDDYKMIFREVKPLIDSADLSVGNLECVFRDEKIGEPIYKDGPNLWAYPSDLGCVTVPDFDLLTLANNHFGDYGPEASLYTMKALDEYGFDYIGGGKNIEDAYLAKRYTIKGVSFSILSVCENESGGALANTPGSAAFNYPRLLAAIRREREASDKVIVVFHGGHEQNPFPSPDVVDRYHTVIDLGADALIGMHTHCIEGYEFYHGCPIVYSMGNFLFADNPAEGNVRPKGWKSGYMTRLSLDGDGKFTVEPIPYVYRQEDKLLEICKGEDREKMLAYIDRLSAPLADREELEAIFDGWSLIKGPNYANFAFFWRSEWVEMPVTADEERKKLAKFANIFSCEAHIALLHNYTRVLCDNARRERAEKRIDRIKDLQIPPVV